jgi:ArsR family transcriptional regulator
VERKFTPVRNIIAHNNNHYEKETFYSYFCDGIMTMTNELPYTFQFLEASTETLRAIAHPHRLLIMEMLYQEKSLNVTEIYEKLGIEQAVASHHLRILKDRGVVQVRRDGKNSNYSLTDDRYYKILLVLNELIPE